MNKKTILWILVLILTTQLVLGLGLRPAKTTIDFKPNLDREHSFWVVNNDNIDFEVNIYVEGELGEYIDIQQNNLIFKEDDDSKKVTYRINLPENLPAGDVKANIVVEEVLNKPKNPYEFSAKLVLKHKVIVKVPYPEKFVEGELDIKEEDKKINLITQVKNLGTKTIEDIKTRFYINDQRETIESTETDEASLDAGETKELKAEIPKSKLDYGEFDILANVIYDGYKLELMKKLIMGEPEIEILYFDKYFIFGKINKFTVNLLNKWNKKLEKVFVEIFVFKDDKQVDQIRTASFDIEGKESDNIEGYFDTTNKELGDYQFEVVVDYNGKKTHKRFTGTVLNEEDYEEAQKERSNLTFILIGILFILIIIVFSILLTRRRKHGR